jgi:Domain of unknown function (DUF4349)
MKFFTLPAPMALMALPFIACNSIAHKPGLKPDDRLDALVKNKVIKSNKEIQDQSALTADSTVAGWNDTPPQKEKVSQKGAPGTTADWDKKIVKTATLSLEVRDFKGFDKNVHTGIKHLGGYVGQEEQNESSYKIENTITIRIPVDQFEEAIDEFTDGQKIMEKKISAADVTTQMVDTKSRIAARTQVRLRYLDLLKQAKNMEEILTVEKEVNDIQEQLESAAGQVEYLGHAAAFSTITLTYYQVLNPGAIEEKSPSFLHEITAAFCDGLRWVGAMAVMIISLWPLWMIVLLIWFGLKRIKAKKPKTA